MEKGKKAWRVAILAVLATALLVLLIVAGNEVFRAYNNWRLNRYHYQVQERLYESIGMLFASVQMLILLAAILIISLIRLIWSIRGRSPQKDEMKNAVGHQRRLRHIPAARTKPYALVAFMVVFLLLFISDRIVLGRIANTVETSEVPAALRDYFLRGWLQIGAELTAIGAIISLTMRIKTKDAF